jgi:hypothetical protein
MTDESQMAKGLRDRLGTSTEERLGRALSDLLESPLLSAAIGRAFEAREKASQAQEVAMGALNIPSAGDIERLTRRLRSVSHRLEGIEDGIHQLNRALSPSGVDARLSAIERQLEELGARAQASERARGAAARADSGVSSGAGQPATGASEASAGQEATRKSKGKGSKAQGKKAKAPARKSAL